MTRQPGIATDLAAAVREVNAARDRLPEPLRPELDLARWNRLQLALDRCRSAERAHELIAEWSHDERAQLTTRLLHAPLMPGGER